MWGENDIYFAGKLYVNCIILQELSRTTPSHVRNPVLTILAKKISYDCFD